MKFSCGQRPAGRAARLVPLARSSEGHRRAPRTVRSATRRAGQQALLTGARRQLGLDAAIWKRVVVVCRKPLFEQRCDGRRVVVRWTRGLSACAWCGVCGSARTQCVQRRRGARGTVARGPAVSGAATARGAPRAEGRGPRVETPKGFPDRERAHRGASGGTSSEASHAPCRPAGTGAPAMGGQAAHLGWSCDAGASLLSRCGAGVVQWVVGTGAKARLILLRTMQPGDSEMFQGRCLLLQVSVGDNRSR